MIHGYWLEFKGPPIGALTNPENVVVPMAVVTPYGVVDI
jgi:hypothetical protein